MRTREQIIKSLISKSRPNAATTSKKKTVMTGVRSIILYRFLDLWPLKEDAEQRAYECTAVITLENPQSGRHRSQSLEDRIS